MASVSSKSLLTASSSPTDLRIVFISTYPPRRCGIASFTKDLSNAINNLNPDRLAEIIAMDDSLSEVLSYPWEVSHRIRQNNWSDYQKVLEYLNNSVVDIISIQHEFGIFGGPDGDLIVEFAKKLKKPYIITFHSVLEQPNPNQKRIVQELSKLAQSVVVMLSVAADVLARVYNIPIEKVTPIHHGAPDFPFAEDDEAKAQLGLSGKVVMSNINLLGEGRGIEYAINALPDVVKAYPNFMYLIIGQTHPVVLHNEGEKYRNKLRQLVRRLKLGKYVRFVNDYVPLNLLIDYIRASDFYITPYENMETMSSGSLAYAIAAGKPCIATPYRYAREMLTGNRGYLVPPKDAGAIRDVLLRALNDPEEMAKIRKKCYAQGRRMTWSRVAFRHIQLMENLLRQDRYDKQPILPNLSYLHYLTHRYGLLEHTVKNRKSLAEGYSTDDNARALMVAIQYNDHSLAQRYFDFLVRAEHDGRFYCDRDAKGKFVGELGLGDWFGRTFWALSYAMRFGPTATMRKRATEMIRRMLPLAHQTGGLRADAYVLLGLSCLKKLEWDELAKERQLLVDALVQRVKQANTVHSDADWHWVEPALSYDNPRIPQALIEIGDAYNSDEIKNLGLKLLDFVLDSTFDILGNHFCFVGNRGWYKKGKTKAPFDEQPLEAGATVGACFAAFEVTQTGYYREMAQKAFEWYWGDNILRRPLYNQKRGSIYDGITPNGLNLNQGAESVLEYLLAWTCYAKLK